ncbi:MAG TPA: hypothetical protein VNY29_02135 [Terriglobales bacterium]|jgi:hypothetical protein|nr:hypothetical protein [Terriglobales bacterium]
MWRSPAFVLVAFASALASPDLTVKTVTHVEDLGTKPDLLSSSARQENLYLQGHNWRRESLSSLEPGLRDFSFATPRLVTIERCDEGLQYQLNPATREYIRSKTSPPATNRLSRLHWRIGRKDPPAADGVTYAALDSETEDTGETQTVFGQTAHHFITRTRRRPTAGSGQPESLYVADGWFLEGLAIPRGCPLKDSGAWVASGSEAQAGALEGPKPLGLPVRVKYTSKFTLAAPDGGVDTQIHVREREVVELSDRPLESKLFEVPKGYKRVKHFRRARSRTPRARDSKRPTP